jgi:hypothetical protein
MAVDPPLEVDRLVLQKRLALDRREVGADLAQIDDEDPLVERSELGAQRAELRGAERENALALLRGEDARQVREIVAGRRLGRPPGEVGRKQERECDRDDDDRPDREQESDAEGVEPRARWCSYASTAL